MTELMVGQMLWFFAAPLAPGAVAPAGAFAGRRELRDASRAAKQPAAAPRPLVSFLRGQLANGDLDLLVVADDGVVHPTGGVEFWDGSGDPPDVDYVMVPGSAKAKTQSKADDEQPTASSKR